MVSRGSRPGLPIAAGWGEIVRYPGRVTKNTPNKIFLTYFFERKTKVLFWPRPKRSQDVLSSYIGGGSRLAGGPVATPLLVSGRI